MDSKRVNSKENRNSMHTYEDGSAVRKISGFPEREDRAPSRQRLSNRMKENRRRAVSMSRGYVIFLSVICAATVLVCVNFLQLKAQLTTQSDHLASLEQSLATKRAENDAYYASVLSSVNMDKLKEDAFTRFGLNYPDQSQVIYYSTKDNSYVRQYEDVEENQ